mmetsp:Transcript_127684/g.408721  ORF Transcript_127684/g.408721 Transcript_127684/m.408721 type:complete len:366 (+) Transcript_127684:866-1963(+)
MALQNPQARAILNAPKSCGSIAGACDEVRATWREMHTSSCGRVALQGPQAMTLADIPKPRGAIVGRCCEERRRLHRELHIRPISDTAFCQGAAVGERGASKHQLLLQRRQPSQLLDAQLQSPDRKRFCLQGHRSDDRSDLEVHHAESTKIAILKRREAAEQIVSPAEKTGELCVGLGRGLLKGRLSVKPRVGHPRTALLSQAVLLPGLEDDLCTQHFKGIIVLEARGRPHIHGRQDRAGVSGRLRLGHVARGTPERDGHRLPQRLSRGSTGDEAAQGEHREGLLDLEADADLAGPVVAQLPQTRPLEEGLGFVCAGAKGGHRQPKCRHGLVDIRVREPRRYAAQGKLLNRNPGLLQHHPCWRRWN